MGNTTIKSKKLTIPITIYLLTIVACASLRLWESHGGEGEGGIIMIGFEWQPNTRLNQNAKG